MLVCRNPGIPLTAYIVGPDITIQSAAAPPVTLRLLLVALGLEGMRERVNLIEGEIDIRGS